MDIIYPFSSLLEALNTIPFHYIIKIRETVEIKISNSTYRLALSKANPDITLEPYVITTRELESIKTSLQALRVGIVVPFAKYRWICGTTILIRDQIFILNHIFHSFCNATSGEATVN